MRATMVGAMLMAGVMMTGCGRAPALSVLPLTGSQIASRSVVADPAPTLVISQATTREAMVGPGAGYRTVYTVSGKDRAVPFTLVVETFNPGSLFVAKLTAVTLNGARLQDAAVRRTWSERLLQALPTAPQGLHLTISEASNYVARPLPAGS